MPAAGAAAAVATDRPTAPLADRPARVQPRDPRAGPRVPALPTDRRVEWRVPVQPMPRGMERRAPALPTDRQGGQRVAVPSMDRQVRVPTDREPADRRQEPHRCPEAVRRPHLEGDRARAAQDSPVRHRRPDPEAAIRSYPDPGAPRGRRVPTSCHVLIGIRAGNLGGDSVQRVARDRTGPTARPLGGTDRRHRARSTQARVTARTVSPPPRPASGRSRATTWRPARAHSRHVARDRCRRA
jgi:hypothetical protein